jgi:hypothetical protein
MFYRSFINAIKSDSIPIKSENDKTKLLNNLKIRLDSLSPSLINNIAPINKSFAHIRNKNEEIFRGKG